MGVHDLRLRIVHRHARLAEDVFAGVKRGNGDGLVHVGPCADKNEVEVVAHDEFLPGVFDMGNVKFLCGGFARRAGSVGDRQNFDAVDLTQAGHMAGTADSAQPYDSDPDHCGPSLRKAGSGSRSMRIWSSTIHRRAGSMG